MVRVMERLSVSRNIAADGSGAVILGLFRELSEIDTKPRLEAAALMIAAVLFVSKLASFLCLL